ncbi:class I SAM-dependent methyltransferase [Nonomuraea sp. B19D2]|uniref:class I SAM-dependent methyltransferase n=1 Tax=Nonomuraea sp. B19D2 TaxID=3159561 RepID=UPI0032D9E91B
MALRGRELDRWTREFLTAHPEATVPHLACGLDTRVHRLDPPPSVRWFDIDFPDVIEARPQAIPDRPHVHSIAANLTEPGWLEEMLTRISPAAT